MDYMSLVLMLRNRRRRWRHLDHRASTGIRCPAASQLNYGSDEQRPEISPAGQRRWLGLLLPDRTASAPTPPPFGPRTAGAGRSLVLNGVKQFITTGKNAQVAIVFAVTDKASGKGISCFLVPTDTPGYIVARLEEKWAARLRRADPVRELPDSRRPAARPGGGATGSPSQPGGRPHRHRRKSMAWRAGVRRRHELRQRNVSRSACAVEHQAGQLRLADMATRIDAARQDGGAPPA